MPKCLIVSNRLPLYFDEVTQSLKSSSGGLVSALKGLQLDKLNLDIEWLAPVCDQKLIHVYKDEMSPSSNVVPIEVEQKQYEQYYNFYSNKLLWALFHYERPDLPLKSISWDAYQMVNQQVANMIIERAQGDDLVWVHDYHLMLVPELVKQHHPKIKIGFFLHIPFPHYEFFREIPQGDEILRSLKSCDLIGFHDGTYLNYYQQTVERMHKGSIQHQQLAKAYPISIDTPHFIQLGEEQDTISLREKYQMEKNGVKWILGVDRLDLIKGLLLKLDAFKLFLTNNPQYRQKVQLLQVIVPSRTQVEEYQNLKTQIEQMISQINGEFSTPTWMPIRYLYHSVTENELCALYQSCEVLFISSKRDGMNLVSLEYIACQTNVDPGIVVLSEFAGASSSLPFALKINPWDIETTCQQLARALEYPLEERRKELKIMKFFLESYTSTDWATSFIHDLKNTQPLQLKDSTVNVDFYPWLKVPHREKAIVFCDFDGTLAELVNNPEEAKLSSQMAAALKRLEKNKNCNIVIISGRDRSFLEKIFISQGFQFSLVACHGAYFYDAHLKQWEKWITEPHYDWKDEVINTMESFCQRTPGSFLEIKEQSIVWHFRNSPSEFANTISQKLFYDLQDFYQHKPLKVIRGKKIIEVHPKDVGKGKFLESWLRKSPSTMTQYFALGDDQTDEDMFEFLQNHPEISSYCIKVGPGQSKANYQISDQAQVEVFLNYLHQNYEEYSP